MEPRKDLTTLGLERMLLTEDLIISCRTTCGCGNKLVPYTKQSSDTHYLLTCEPFSEKYEHPLLIAIDKNSPVFKKAAKYDNLVTAPDPIGKLEQENKQLKEDYEELDKQCSVERETANGLDYTCENYEKQIKELKNRIKVVMDYLEDKLKVKTLEIERLNLTLEDRTDEIVNKTSKIYELKQKLEKIKELMRFAPITFKTKLKEILDSQEK